MRLGGSKLIHFKIPSREDFDKFRGLHGKFSPEKDPFKVFGGSVVARPSQVAKRSESMIVREQNMSN